MPVPLEAQEVQKFEQVVHRLDPQSRLLRAWLLYGGVSARVTALEVERPDGQRHKMLVRQHGAADLKLNPQIAADEFKLLQHLHRLELATPIPYDADQSGEIFGTPYIVIEFIEGETDFAPADLNDSLRQTAAQLAKIHSGEIVRRWIFCQNGRKNRRYAARTPRQTRRLARRRAYSRGARLHLPLPTGQ